MTDLEIVELAARRLADHLRDEARMASTSGDEITHLVHTSAILTRFADNVLYIQREVRPK